MPIQIIWGNDLNACNQFIEQFIKKNVSEIWQEINLSQLNGTDINQIFIAFEEILTPPMGDGSRVVVLKNNPMFTNKNEELRNKFEKIYENIPNNNYLILQSIKKPDSRLKSTKFIQSLIKKDLANETSFSLPDIWDLEGQKRYLQIMANSMSLSLDENVAELIINSVGNDSLQLINELTKAKIYLSTSGHASNSTLQITQKNVKEIFNNHYSNIFRIIDFLLEKKIPECLLEIHFLLQKGEPALRLNASLISQIRTHTIVKLLHKSGMQDLSDICKLANISNPKRIFFIKKKIHNVSSDFLIQLMNYLLNIESLIKKGNNPIDVFTENLVNLN